MSGAVTMIFYDIFIELRGDVTLDILIPPIEWAANNESRHAIRP